MALPGAVSGLIEAAGNPAMRQTLGEAPAGASVLRALVRSREAAVVWRPAGRMYTDIALARLMLAESGDATERDEQLALAETALAKGLGLSPMDPYGWMRLVQVRTMRGRPPEDIASPLRLALYSGPEEDRRDAILLLMLASGLRVWDDLNGHERRLIADKAKEAWRRNALATAAVAARVGETARLARLLGF